MKPNIPPNLRQQSVEQARQTIERRVNELGVAEPSIAQQGQDGDPRRRVTIADRNGRAERYEDRYATYAYRGNPDFNYRAFRTTNVLRWEYKPGSALFLVWQQGKSDSEGYGDFNFSRDFRGVFSAPSHNVFLVKFSYWLNM